MDEDTGPIEALRGDRDASVPICAIDRYRHASWIPVHGFPHRLRANGWAYLRTRGHLMGRLRAVGVQWRARRPSNDGSGFGPGRILLVDPDSFEDVDIDLGELASHQRSGIRYLRAARSGRIVHLSADNPVPRGDWDD